MAKRKTPFPHQIKGHKYLVDRRSGFLLFKMRMGKSFVVVMAIKTLNEYPVLIVCPKIVLETWRKELIDEGCSPKNISIVDYSSPKKNEAALLSNKYITIVNFDKLKNYDILNKRKWKVVIVDELDRLANVSAGITRYFLRNPQPIYQRRYGLSGAPAPESALNLVTEYLIILGEFMGYKTYNKYVLENWSKNMYSGKWEVQNSKHRYKIDAWVKRTACISTMKDIGKGAKFVLQPRFVKMNKAQRILYERAEKIYQLNRIHGGDPTDIDPAKMLRRLNQKQISAGINPYNNHEIISVTKIKDAVDYWKWYKEPMVVTSAYKPPIPVCAEMFRKAGARVGIITGDVKKREDRERIRLAFMEGKLDIIIAQTKAIKMGLDFSIADIIYVLSNTDSGSDREQLVDRIQHLEATNVKTIIDCHSEGSRDEAVLDSLYNKGRDSMTYFT